MRIKSKPQCDTGKLLAPMDVIKNAVTTILKVDKEKSDKMLAQFQAANVRKREAKNRR